MILVAFFLIAAFFKLLVLHINFIHALAVVILSSPWIAHLQLEVVMAYLWGGLLVSSMFYISREEDMK